MKREIDRITRRLLHTSQHDKIPIFLAGRIQDDIEELRRLAALPAFKWTDPGIPDAEVRRCSVCTDDCLGQERHHLG